MRPDVEQSPSGVFEDYRAIIDVVASWETLVGLAERIHDDPRLLPKDRERLLAVVGVREPWIRPDWVQPPTG